MSSLDELAVQIELHAPEGIRQHFENGVSPDSYYKGQPLFYLLVSMYTRTPRFKDCVRVFTDHGLKWNEPVLLAVLLDDAISLEHLVQDDPVLVSKRFTLPAAYTPFAEVSLLHICAEFNHLACLQCLLKHGADVNARAGKDEYGFGGQTPVFHTVNQNGNASAESMQVLLAHGADLNITVRGLIWGKDQEWETLIPAVNPISYAMMGLLPQMHRDEKTIAVVVSHLLKQAYGVNYTPRNVPCAYLCE